MNARLGGTNQRIADNFMTTPTIIFGADVTHPAPGSMNDTPSVAAVVYSMDKEGFQYSGDIRYQTGRVELIQELEVLVTQGLREHMVKNPKPQRLFFFRDGVSEGQFDQVRTFELPQIKNACTKLGLNGIKISLIITQKRHHNRFSALSNDDQYKDTTSGNLLPGIVVETGITHPTDYDFFLLTHAGIKGVSRPCYYRILLDENKIHPDQLQTFIYHSCYLFARCLRSVSLFPAVYYADLLCERGRKYLSEGKKDTTIKKKIGGMFWL